MRIVYILIITVLAVAASFVPASAYDAPKNTQLIYECQITNRFKKTAPFTGVLLIKVNDEGIINGEWRDNSIRPDPFYGGIVLVNGSINGDYVNIRLGTGGKLTVKGKISDEGIVGTFYDVNKRTYDFNAVRVTRE